MVDPRIIPAAGVVLEKDGKILLLKRKVEPEMGKWCLPGGHIDFGETPEETVKREVKEETGLDADDFKLICYQTEMGEYKGTEQHYVAFFFSGKASGEEQPCPDEVEEIKWFALEEAMKIDLAFSHNEVLEKYHDGGN